jgi:hypothetical protein
MSSISRLESEGKNEEKQLVGFLYPTLLESKALAALLTLLVHV